MRTALSTSLLIPTILLTMWLGACGEGAFEAGESIDVEEVSSSLTSSQRRQRVTMIQQASAEVGLTNAVVIAGIANSETFLAHCWSELTWACKGPASASCGGGPVVAGSGDGPCRNEQGGLGYFQFDAGTYTQTINLYGRDVLTVEGNTRHAVTYVVDMVRRSRYVSGVSTDEQALAWLETVRVDGTNWDAWIKTVVHYYNGCVPGRCSKYNQRYGKYSKDTRDVYNEFGFDFWYGNTQSAEPLVTPTSIEPPMANVSRGDFIPLGWERVQGASRYEVAMEYSASGDQWSNYHTWTNRTSNAFNVWPQTQNANYRWRVRACQIGGCSDWSTFGHFVYGNPAVVVGPGEVLGTEPDPVVEPDPIVEPEGIQSPGAMSPAGGTMSRPSVQLTWSEVADATRYDVDMQFARTRNAWNDYYTWTGRSGESFTVWPQTDNADYRWRVRACDNSECSDWSDFESFYFNGK